MIKKSVVKCRNLREDKMRKVLLALAIVLISGFTQAALCAVTASGPETVPRMTKEELKANLSNPDFVIIDVLATHDWQDSNTKIKGLFGKIRINLNPG